MPGGFGRARYRALDRGLQPGLWPAQAGGHSYRVEEFDNWPKNLWAYVHVFDVAQAHRLAVEKDAGALHEAYFITATENWTGRDSAELLAAHYPEVTDFRNGFSGARSILSHAKAHDMLGYTPHYSVKDLVAL